MATQNYFKVKNGLEFPSIETLQTTDNTGPSIKPSLNLDFAKTKALDPRITFSRASTATYYDGETTAKAEENLFTSSQDINGVGWNTLNIQTRTSNATTAPDGTSTAGKFTSTTTDARHLLVNYIYGVTAGTTYTFSAYFKAAEYANIALGFENLTGGVKKSAILDLTTGMIKPLYDDNSTATFSNFSYTAVSVGNGWYRASVTATASISMSFITAQFTASPSYSPALSTGMPSYAGDGVSGLYIWGAQAEARDRMSAYTPTTTSPITNYIPVLQTAATNAARFDHDPITGESKGLLIEESRTNLILHSQSMDVSYWSIVNGSLIANATVAPDGSASADLYVANTTSSLKGVLPFGGVTISANSAHTLSYYVKSYGPQYVSLTFDDTATTNGLSATFDLVNGTVSRTATAYGTGTASGSSITPIGNGWYRISVSGTAGTGVSFARCILTIAPNSTAQFSSYTGNGFSGIYVWGAQLEVGSFATSYVPTSLTYTGRGSTATYKGSNGLIQTAAANVARYETNAFGGSNLLLENASSNVLNYTETIDLALPNLESPNSFVITRNAGVAPDGSFTATKIRNISASDYMAVYRSGYPGAGTYTMSVWLRADTTTTAKFMVYDANLSNTVTVTPTWQRFTFTETVNTSCNPQIRTLKGVDVYVWGVQLESGIKATSYIPSIETHTGRSSTGTYYDSTGTIRTAASGQPRYTYNPSMLAAPPKLLLEAQSTNVVTNSITMFPSGNITRADNVTTSPEGTTTGSSWTEYSGGSTYQRTSVAITHAAGNTYCVSIYAKAGLRNYVTLDYGPLIYFNLTTGEATGTTTLGGANGLKGYGSQYVGNGWWRCWIVYAYDVVGGQIYLGTSANGSDGGLYTGNSSAPAFYAWGIQKEVGYAPTSYIATSGSAVTRAADTCTSVAQTRAADVYSSSQVTRSSDSASMTGANFSSWYRTDEGSFYSESIVNNVGTMQYPYVAQAVDSSGYKNVIGHGYGPTPYASNSVIASYIRSNNVEQVAYYPTLTKGSPMKALTAYKTNDFASAINGGTVGVDTSGAVPIVSSFFIGNGGGTQFLNGTINKIAYYPKRLSNAELVSITS